jgi:ATP-dependent exoDNAse (exonuclease V) alpha subunit
MAIFFCRASIISRKAGQSVIARAAYNARDKLLDQTTGEIKNYKKKGSVIYKGISAPDGAPAWALDRSELWNRVEQAEKRKDAQIARQFIIAIPHELEKERAIQAIKEISKNLTQRGMIVDIAVHPPDEEGDERNIHAHLLTTMREIDRDGFSRKNRSWNDRDYYKQMESEFAEIFNRHLREIGVPTIDHRPYTKQNEEIKDIENWKVPTKHIGVDKKNLERREAQRLKEIDRELNKLKEMGYDDSRFVGIDRPHRNRDYENGKRVEGNVRIPKNANSRDRKTDPSHEDRATKPVKRDRPKDYGRGR